MAFGEFIRSAVGKGAAPAAQKDSGAPAPAHPDAHQGNADGFVAGAADASPAPITTTTTDQLRRSAGKTAVRVIGALTLAALAEQTAGCIYINGRPVSVGTGDGQSTDAATATTKPVNNEAPVFIGTELSPTLVQAGKDYLSGKDDDHPLINSEIAMDISVPNHPQYNLFKVGTYMPDPGGNGNGNWIGQVLGAQLVPTTIKTTDIRGNVTTTEKNVPVVLVGTTDADGNRILVEVAADTGAGFGFAPLGLNKNSNDHIGFGFNSTPTELVKTINSANALVMNNPLLDQSPAFAGTHYLYNPALVLIPHSTDPGVANARAGKPTYGVFRNAAQLANTPIDGAKLIKFAGIAQLINQPTK